MNWWISTLLSFQGPGLLKMGFVIGCGGIDRWRHSLCLRCTAFELFYCGPFSVVGSQRAGCRVVHHLAGAGLGLKGRLSGPLTPFRYEAEV